MPHNTEQKNLNVWVHWFRCNNCSRRVRKVSYYETTAAPHGWLVLDDYRGFHACSVRCAFVLDPAKAIELVKSTTQLEREAPVRKASEVRAAKERRREQEKYDEQRRVARLDTWKQKRAASPTAVEIFKTSVKTIPGLDVAARERLHKLGIGTIGALLSWSEDLLHKHKISRSNSRRIQRHLTSSYGLSLVQEPVEEEPTPPPTEQLDQPQG